ncbi:WXG100-like domain-containing protein, partial [Streptomyces fumanus]|uniref:WXG100-like domain-containing protein n=1 Tax=Streptomyces fumanus TaxID=67302 RepID=UPI00167D651C
YIEFSDEARVLCFILIGESPIQANSRAALESSRVYVRLSTDLETRAGDLNDSVRDIRDALPGSAGEEYERSVAKITGGGRRDGLLSAVGDFALQIGDGQRVYAQMIFKAKVGMEFELALCAMLLASLAAMAFFTAGASLTQTALVKARTRLQLLTIMHFLSRHNRLVPGLSEAVEEGLLEFLTQLTVMSAAPPELRPRRIDWRDIARSGTLGLFAGLFTDITRKFLDPFTRLPKDTPGGKFSRDLLDGIADGVSEALGETLGDFVNTGMWDKKWEFRTTGMLGAGISGTVTSVLGSGLTDLGTSLAQWKYQNLN